MIAIFRPICDYDIVFMLGHIVLLVPPFAASSSNNNVYSSYIVSSCPFVTPTKPERNADAPLKSNTVCP